ncbi:membrane protein [Neosynechococcus sphagnicola sy1]|uniref:Membrane protein n=1 Tax=Neosynechococcus sphagnicola sy1 TaxID=1497020 RepID=A0A098TIG3_9CYAN|nr:vitamin K epoxide reductase family protein [Neosynechococcus sphagnicola]KGF71816.1 membrane protein [Neosynechococcus sphagnicola sy1]
MRRRSTPWIHRWSRPLIGAIALVGALGTAYLTIVKLTGGSAACPTGGCEQVLNSPYGSVFGLPLPLFGFVAYLGMGILAVAPLLVTSETNKELRTTLEKWTWLLLFIGGIAMAVFSGYLMYILAFKLKVLCLYCLASAMLSLSLFFLALLGHVWEDVGQLFFTGIVVGMIVLVSTLGVYAKVNGSSTATSGSSLTSPPITTTSGPAELALAKHLHQIGAKEYGAYWCPHCFEQKLLFGQEASAIVNYIECDPKGKNGRPDLCQAAKIEGFPTWDIKGQRLTGTQPLETLAQTSGYQGPRNFKNVSPQPSP